MLSTGSLHRSVQWVAISTKQTQITAKVAHGVVCPAWHLVLLLLGICMFGVRDHASRLRGLRRRFGEKLDVILTCPDAGSRKQQPSSSSASLPTSCCDHTRRMYDQTTRFIFRVNFQFLRLRA